MSRYYHSGDTLPEENPKDKGAGEQAGSEAADSALNAETAEPDQAQPDLNKADHAQADRTQADQTDGGTPPGEARPADGTGPAASGCRDTEGFGEPAVFDLPEEEPEKNKPEASEKASSSSGSDSEEDGQSGESGASGSEKDEEPNVSGTTGSEDDAESGAGSGAPSSKEDEESGGSAASASEDEAESSSGGAASSADDAVSGAGGTSDAASETDLSPNESRGDMEAAGELGQEEGGEAAPPPPAGTDNPDDSSGTEEEGDAGGKDGPNETRQEEDSEEEPKESRRERRRKSKKRKAADPLQEKRDTERSDSIKESVVYWQGDDRIPEKLEDLKGTLKEVVGLGSSFDLVYRAMRFGERDAALVFISGFAKDVILDEILKRLTYLSPENVSTDAIDAFVLEYIPHIQVERGTELSVALAKMLSGYSLLFINGESVVVMMDTRNYPVRSPDEPTIERVVRGSRDGFTETLMTNVALVRRRIRDPGLRFETSPVGRRSRTDVSVAYIDDIADKTQIKAVKDKLKEIDIDGIPLADKQLEEAIIGRGWHPYPMVRYSERPDVVASHLLEGRVVLFVDTSPSVIITPTTFFDLCQHAEENRQTPFMGTYLRWVRFAGIFASMFLLPLWLLLVIHPELKPPMLDFIGPHENAKVPLLAQFLMIEFGVDLLRMAAVHTPTPLGSAMGLIAAILIGDIAVQTGLFVNEVVLYMAVAAIGMFATPSYELGLANRVVRLALLILAAAFQVPGFMIGTTALILLLTVHRSYNSSYLWPFIPFNAKAIGAILLRQPLLRSGRRPSFNKTRDSTRIGRKQGGKH